VVGLVTVTTEVERLDMTVTEGLGEGLGKDLRHPTVDEVSQYLGRVVRKVVQVAQLSRMIRSLAGARFVCCCSSGSPSAFSE
jgi:hypothetical protein